MARGGGDRKIPTWHRVNCPHKCSALISSAITCQVIVSPEPQPSAVPVPDRRPRALARHWYSAGPLSPAYQSAYLCEDAIFTVLAAWGSPSCPAGPSTAVAVAAAVMVPPACRARASVRSCYCEHKTYPHHHKIHTNKDTIPLPLNTYTLGPLRGKSYQGKINSH